MDPRERGEGAMRNRTPSPTHCQGLVSARMARGGRGGKVYEDPAAASRPGRASRVRPGGARRRRSDSKLLPGAPRADYSRPGPHARQGGPEATWRPRILRRR